MFGDPVTNPKGWEVGSIKDIAQVKTGKTPSRKESDNYGGSVPWVKTTEVKDCVIEDTEEHLTDKGASQMTVFPEQSILVAMYGQGTTRGKTALLGKPSTTNQACSVILPSKKYNTIYLWSLLQLSYKNLRELSRGGNQPNLNLDIIKKFPICIPPLKNQNHFAILEIKRRKQQDRMVHTLQESENLFNSLLQRAFRGEL
jgi:type I restriction enzyme, S subunit